SVKFKCCIYNHCFYIQLKTTPLRLPCQPRDFHFCDKTQKDDPFRLRLYGEHEKPCGNYQIAPANSKTTVYNLNVELRTGIPHGQYQS
ncbi:TPA: hypothetical protein ACIO66_004758, partial [Salmonella enterica subsp. enterica serovar Weltevreden]